jgi:hypothetical protein
LTSLTIGVDDALVLVVLGGVDVEVDDLRTGREFAVSPVMRSSKRAPKQSSRVALVDGPVAVGGAVHAEPLHGERVGLRETAHAHQGGGDGDVGRSAKAFSSCVRFGRDNAAAGVEDRAFRLGDEGEHLRSCSSGSA